MVILPIVAFLSAFCCAALGVVVALRKQRTAANWAFLAGMAAFASESAFAGLSAHAALPERIVFWQNLKLAALSILPVLWLLFSLSFSRGNHWEVLSRWAPALMSALIFPVSVAVAFPEALTARVIFGEAGPDQFIAFGWAGFALNVFFLASSVLVLMNLESTFRAAVGTLRWQIKFMILGLAILFVVRVYTCSQTLLYSGVKSSMELINSGALLIACSLMSWSLFRSRQFHLDLYPSQLVLHRSLTVILVGSYLVTVGVLAEAVSALGGTAAFPLKAFLILMALAFLGILLMSDRLRLRTKRFVSRHFQRPLYDYRKAWSAFTVRTTSTMDEAELCRKIASLVSETFDALTVTIWLVDNSRKQLIFGASTSIQETETREFLESNPDLSELIRTMHGRPIPQDVDQGSDRWSEAFKRCNPDHFRKGGHRVGVPLVGGDELLGIMVLGDRVSGIPFSQEDYEFLKCIGDGLAANLLKIRLAQRILEAKQMEAFQTMSAFLVHDLKNTASTLSLLLQNLGVHFGDPMFREDALRAVSKSVSHVNDLIGQLTGLRRQIEMKPIEADLKNIVSSVLAELKSLERINLVEDLHPVPRLHIDPGQIRTVLINLLLNAKAAVSNDGEIRVETNQQNGWAVVSVSDSGCGMSREFLTGSLFHPFQTTKKNGMGIGMFQSKMIVEAHQGKIEVESEQGKGSTFRVLLPMDRPGGREVKA
jgi:putative PEP-CTERM system histidine kinase